VIDALSCVIMLAPCYRRTCPYINGHVRLYVSAYL